MSHDDLTILTSLMGDFFNGDVICDEKMLDVIKKSNILVYERILQSLMNQKKIDKSAASYVLYKTEILTGETTLVVEINDDIGDQFHTTLDSDGDNIYLHTYSYADIWNLIQCSQDAGVNYIFIPLLYSSRYNKASAHIAPIVFDISNQKVYIFEPNGNVTFFNDIMSLSNKPFEDFDVDTNIYAKLLFDTYLAKMNEMFGSKFEYIECVKWNPKGLIANRKFKESVKGSGHCAMLTIMLPHLLTILDYEVKEIYNMVASLSDTEIIYLINGYTAGMNVYVNDLFNKNTTKDKIKSIKSEHEKVTEKFDNVMLEDVVYI